MNFAAWILVIAAAFSLSLAVQHNFGCASYGLTKVESGLTKAEKTSIKKLHNEIRKKVAKGQHEGAGGSMLPKASNMNKVVWDMQLAQDAQDHADHCMIEMDNPAAGEYDKIKQLTDFFRIGYSIEDMIQNWGKDMNGFNDKTVGMYDSASMEIGLALISSAETEKIGCGFAIVMDGNYKQKLLVCNYSPGLANGKPVYLKGEPGSMCSSMGRRKNRSGLCV